MSLPHAALTKILDPEYPAFSLRPEVIELTDRLVAAGRLQFDNSGDIAAGESRTDRGLALSPRMAAMCADDYVRTIQFIRGVHAAYKEARDRAPHRAIRILYAGCGPFAILIVPLLSLFDPGEVSATLLDVHDESIESARTVLQDLGLSDRVESFEVADAGTYRIDPDRRPDIVVLEIMQACLESEPQVAVTRHLMAQAPEAILVPQEIRIEAVLVDPSCEFPTEISENETPDSGRDRPALGPVFVVNRDTVAAWEPQAESLPGAEIQLPDALEPRYQLMLFTLIQVHGDCRLQGYDSGLTCPRVPTIEGALRAGIRIGFRYELGSTPRLVAAVL